MRDTLIGIWRKLTQIKLCIPIIRLIRYIAATNAFNTLLDFLEIYVCHTSYAESKEYYFENIDRIRTIMSWLGDEKSRETYWSMWKYRITHERGFLKGIVSKDQYFDQTVISMGQEECFVDGGAYNGDTVKKFIKICGGGHGDAYEHIYAFEPDPFNYSRLRTGIRKELKKSPGKIDTFQIGLWERRANLAFKGDIEEACMISAEGSTQVEVDSIDHVIGDRRVTFIKLDIEGAELNAIRGAKKTIERWRPKMAVCIYHKDSDMVDIAEYIKERYPFYKIYIRHHSWFYADTVLYAIP